MGFKAIVSNSYIFIRVIGKELVIIALYINNILIFTKSESLINAIKKEIKKAFNVTDSRRINRILGIQVHRTNKALTLD